MRTQTSHGNDKDNSNSNLPGLRNGLLALISSSLKDFPHSAARTHNQLANSVEDFKKFLFS